MNPGGGLFQHLVNSHCEELYPEAISSLFPSPHPLPQGERVKEKKEKRKNKKGHGNFFPCPFSFFIRLTFSPHPFDFVRAERRERRKERKVPG